MIKVTIELHSAITGKTSHLGTLLIANDGTGTKTRGNYDGRLITRDFKSGRRARVLNHPRLTVSVWLLLAEMLHNLFDNAPAGPIMTPDPDPSAVEEPDFIPGKVS